LQKGGSTLEFVAYSKREKAHAAYFAPPLAGEGAVRVRNPRTPYPSCTAQDFRSLRMRSSAPTVCAHPPTTRVITPPPSFSSSRFAPQPHVPHHHSQPLVVHSPSHARKHAARCYGHVITRRSSDQLVASSAGRYPVSCGLSRCAVCWLHCSSDTHCSLAPYQPNRNERVGPRT
jgi:hypothetical protein